MRRFVGASLGRKLSILLCLDRTTCPKVTIYSVADDLIFYGRTIIGAYPLPFNGQRVTIETDGPGGPKNFTWTAERRLVQLGETPLSAILEDTLSVP